MTLKNFQHVRITCPECKHTEILSDYHHGETFCTQCGLVIQETILISHLRWSTEI